MQKTVAANPSVKISPRPPCPWPSGGLPLLGVQGPGVQVLVTDINYLGFFFTWVLGKHASSKLKFNILQFPLNPRTARVHFYPLTLTLTFTSTLTLAAT